MIDFVFALVAMAAAASAPNEKPDAQHSGQTVQSAPAAANVIIGSGVVIGGVPAQPFAAPPGLLAEAQTPSGKFTTATEVQPILAATKGNWVAVRLYEGNDLLYFTHLWSWRCGLGAMAISVNGGPVAQIPLPECHMEYATPNAILEQDGLPYLSYPAGSIESVSVHLIYDNLSSDSAEFARGDILIP